MRRRATRSKYGNKKTMAGGILFDSKGEAHFYLKLLAMQQRGIIKEIELQPKYVLLPSFKKNGVTHKAVTYSADFKVTYTNGDVKIIDVKGKETEVFKIKRKWFESKYPDLTLIIEKV